jgi:hypothetical protein
MIRNSLNLSAGGKNFAVFPLTVPENPHVFKQSQHVPSSSFPHLLWSFSLRAASLQSRIVSSQTRCTAGHSALPSSS